MMDEDFNDVEKQKNVLADQDLSDEFQIKMAMLDFYELAGSITTDNKHDRIKALHAKRNVIINMMTVYLLKFNNQPIMKDFDDALKREKKAGVKDGKLSYYAYYMGDMRVVGVFLGIRENLSEKLADQVFERCKEWERGVQ